jgi:hypothetical protein
VELSAAVVGKVRSSNARVNELAVGVLDGLLKNGQGHVHVALAEAGAADALKTAALGGNKDAAALLQQVGVAYADAPRGPLGRFRDAYRDARSRGAAFPASDEGKVERTITPYRGGGGETEPLEERRFAEQLEQLAEAQAKLLRELHAVAKWIGQCAMLLKAGGGGPSTVPAASREAFLDVVDRLEQCPERLLKLIDAGMAGKVDDACFEKALQVQTALSEVLPWALGTSAPLPKQLEAMCAFGSEEGEAPAAEPASDLSGLFDAPPEPADPFAYSAAQPVPPPPQAGAVEVAEDDPFSAPASSTAVQTELDDFEAFLSQHERPKP